MQNIGLAMNRDSLTIRVDLSQSFGPSSSGKTTIIAPTEGNVPVGPDREEKIRLNVYRARAKG